MAPNLIVQCLEDFDAGFEFESMCNEVMHFHYPGFEPAGGIHDSGVDGLCQLAAGNTHVYFKRTKDQKQTIVFQYSIQEDWETKIKDTLSKLRDNRIPFDHFVLVTNQRINRAKLTKLQAWAVKEYKTWVDVHDLEFLRVYLEDPGHDDIARRYFAPYLEQLRQFNVDTSLFANLPLSERQKRRALVLLSTCVRSPEGQKVKEAAATEVILGCIYGDGTKKTCSRDDIVGELSHTFRNGSCLSDQLIDDTLAELTVKGRITVADGEFCLSESERVRIDSKIASSCWETPSCLSIEQLG